MKLRISDKEISQLVKEAVEQGFSVARTAKGHLKLSAPGGGCCFAPGTPSDFRSIRDVRSKLRRLGFNDRRNQ